MKNIWLWIVGIGVVAVVLWKKSQSTSAKTQAASAGITNNPIANFWGINTNATAAQNVANAQTNLTAAKSFVSGFTGIFGGSNSPQTSAGGSGGPTQAQVKAASTGDATDTGYGGSAQLAYGGGDDETTEYGDDSQDDDEG